MAGFTKKMNASNEQVATNAAEFVARLNAVKTGQNYILYRLGDRQSLFRVDRSASGETLVWHYDLKGRPMAQDIKLLIEQVFPKVEPLDVSRQERLQAMLHSGGEFNFYQDSTALPDALEKLAGMAAVKPSAAAELVGKTGFFAHPRVEQTSTPPGSSVEVVRGKKI